MSLPKNKIYMVKLKIANYAQMSWYPSRIIIIQNTAIALILSGIFKELLIN